MAGTRLLENNWRGPMPVEARDASPWIPSGVLTASAQIKAVRGLLGGILVTASDAGGDIVVKVWDSPNSTLTDDVCLAAVTIISTVSGAQNSFAPPSKEGVEAINGLYVQVTGDCEVIVYYK